MIVRTTFLSAVRRGRRLAPALLVAALVAPIRADRPPVTPAPGPAGYARTVQPFLARYCYGCHNASKAKGGLNLKALPPEHPVAGAANTWESMLAKLRSGEMPPEDEDQPAPAELAAITRWIDTELADADRAAAPEPGRVTARRLNRAEYNRTVRDLLGVDLQPADEFPQDDAGYGFDNIGDVLSVPPLLMERYMVAAERVARAAVFGVDPGKPTLVRCQPKARTLEPSAEIPAGYDATGLSLPNAVHAMRRIPVTGSYRVRVYTGGARPAGAAPIQVAMWVDGERVATRRLDATKQAGFFEDKQDFTGKFRDFALKLTAGDHWIAASIPALFDGLPASYAGPHPSLQPEPPAPVFSPQPGLSAEELAQARKDFEEEHARVEPNAVRVAYFELAGPYDAVTKPTLDARRRLYTCGHLDGRGHGPACLRTIVRSLARRAYRRPITSADTSPILALTAAARRGGASFDETLVVALQAILVSPDFLFRIEPPPPAPSAAPVPLDDHALAARLSYFLWSTMPDRSLRRLADAHTLSRPEVLEAQVRRMLADPRASALVQEFGGQWLQIRALESSAPDKDRFPAFDDYLRYSMRRETELFFSRIVREDRSILEFLNAPWTFVNERLARHYGMNGVHGPAFRAVSLDGLPRGGVLTQASVLTVSSYATRTSPVLRGKWILENLLDAAPPPPPPGVPPLNETPSPTPRTVREQLEAHRTNATCAACHRRMDPLGFGLEHYDGIGAWRDTDGKAAIDASGTLPDGRTFSDAAGLRAILAGEREAFTKALAAKMLTYALGRGLDGPDRRIIRTIARELPKHDYRFSALVLAIVRSPAFRLHGGTSAP